MSGTYGERIRLTIFGQSHGRAVGMTLAGLPAGETLTTTLNVLQVESESMKAYKAIVILIIMVAGSPVIKNWITSLKNRRQASAGAVRQKEVG